MNIHRSHLIRRCLPRHLISLISQRPLGSILVVAGICLLQPRTTTVAADSPTHAAPYLAAVRQFADQALVEGRDVYGKPTSVA